MAMIKCPEPDCNNTVSDQAAAGYGGKDEYEALLKEGWQVVEERA